MVLRRRRLADYEVAIGLASALRSAAKEGMHAAVERVVLETALVARPDRIGQVEAHSAR
jgi:hypothetical protein